MPRRHRRTPVGIEVGRQRDLLWRGVGLVAPRGERLAIAAVVLAATVARWPCPSATLAGLSGGELRLHGLRQREGA